MNTSKNEFLSALLDDEAGEFERRRLLNELNADDELRQTLSRYALAGEVMRSGQQTVVSDSNSFLAGIQAELEDEPVYGENDEQPVESAAPVVPLARPAVAAKSSRSSIRSSRRENVMRFGMAASVAVAALAGILLLQSGGTQNTVNTPGEQMASSESSQGQTAEKPVLVAANTSAADTAVSGTSVRADEPLNLAESVRIRQSNKYLDRQTRDTLKQYVTLHMQSRANNAIVPSIQAVSYSK